jgi:hypothetical protein
MTSEIMGGKDPLAGRSARVAEFVFLFGSPVEMFDGMLRVS